MHPLPVGEPHLKTGEIVGQPMARMPDREALIMSGPETTDSGLILEQERI
jgi:hypothetical protein